MKYLKLYVFLFSALMFQTSLLAQNPYSSIGKEAKTLTLSGGKYQEFFANDTLVEIGSVVFNTITGKVVAFVEKDTMYTEYSLEPEIMSRWLSPDPLAEEYYSLSPYNYVANNPIIYIDPDGREIKPAGLSGAHRAVYDKAIKTKSFSTTFQRLINSKQHTAKLFSGPLKIRGSRNTRGNTTYEAGNFHGEKNYLFSRASEIKKYFVQGNVDGVSDVFANVTINTLFQAESPNKPSGGVTELGAASTLFHEVWHVDMTISEQGGFGNKSQHNAMGIDNDYFDKKIAFLNEFKMNEKGEGLTEKETLFHKWAGLTGSNAFLQTMLVTENGKIKTDANGDAVLSEAGKRYAKAKDSIDLMTGYEKK